MEKINEKFKFNAISLNTRGLNDTKKRKSIFRWLHKLEVDIIFLQETYSSESVHDLWSNQWGGFIAFSDGTNHGKGVAIAIKPGLDYKVIDTMQGPEGRLLILKIVIQGTEFILINIYGPNENNSSAQFFSALEKKLTELKIVETDNIIWGGDFNVIFNPELEKKGGR